MSERLSFGITPLRLAAAHGAVRTTRVLIDAGANIEAKGWIGSTPLLSLLGVEAARWCGC